jgi:hypothetical protein
MNKEIEEAAEIYYENNKFKSDYPHCSYSFKDGAKWQQERMYSEEDVRRITFDFYYDMSHKMNVPENLISENTTNVDEWFKQFKKR